MYSIDGVALKNPTYGWRVKLAGTNPFGGRSNNLADFNASGRDGTVQVRGFIATPTITLVIDTPMAYLDDLLQLLRLGSTLTFTADATKSITCELVSASTTPVVVAGTSAMTSNAGQFRVTAVLRLPGVYWRSVSTTSPAATTLTASGQVINVFTASTAPVRDALVSVKGSITGLAVLASNGTYFSYAPNVPSTSYLTFDASSGRAWTGTAAFAKTTEVTGSIQNGPGPYFLEFNGQSSPANLGTPVTVTYTANTGATFAYQGRDAFDL